MQGQPIVLSKEFNVVLDDLESSRRNFFITGKAGTGKSTLLQTFIQTTDKKCVVVAPTGISALQVGGVTIHSFFKFPPKLLTPGSIRKRKKRKIYQELDTLLIDEISMVRADVFDAMDEFLRIQRNDSRPFGGVQVLCFGDVFQLPPVITQQSEKDYFSTIYQSAYFFHAHVFARLEIVVHELSTVYRQEDGAFIDLLERIRTNQMEDQDYHSLHERYYPAHLPFSPPFITLCTTNAKANGINAKHLQQLHTKSHHYTATTNGVFPHKMQPTQDILSLKEGAQVMFIRNDAEGRFVNGTIGTIEACMSSSVQVMIQEGAKKSIEIGFDRWDIIQYDWNESEQTISSSVIGTFTQLPLKLAWAITIHKSQGQTFDKAVIDLGWGAFAHGQTYVALSRCRTIDGIAIRQKISPSDILVDELIIDFYQTYIRG